VVKNIGTTTHIVHLSVVNLTEESKMNPSIATNLLSLIQVNYPGGLIAFKTNGGNTFAFPNEDHFIICCDKLPLNFMEKMFSASKTFGIELVFFPNQNFQYESNEEVKEWTIKFIQFLRDRKIGDTLPCISPCTIYVEARAHYFDSKEIDELMDFLKSSNMIVRAHVHCKDKIISFGKNRKPKITKEIQPDALPITEDDVRNLVIALNTSTDVTDFLKLI